MYKTRLRKLGKSDVSKCKRRIQMLLRAIALLTYKDCVLSKYPETGACSGPFQAEHLNTRARNISFGDMRNIVLLCQRHHIFWKPQNSRLYWELIRKVIGEKRWEWLKRIEADRKTYTYGIYEWGKIEMALKQELKKYETNL